MIFHGRYDRKSLMWQQIVVFLASALCVVAWGGMAVGQGIAQTKEEWCAAQAVALTKRSNWSLQEVDSYSTHFNTELHRCFMAISSHEGLVRSKMLLDAYAQQTFASYFAMENAPVLTICALLPGAPEERKCASEQDYDLFVDRYMQKNP